MRGTAHEYLITIWRENAGESRWIYVFGYFERDGRMEEMGKMSFAGVWAGELSVGMMGKC